MDDVHNVYIPNIIESVMTQRTRSVQALQHVRVVILLASSSMDTLGE